MIISLKIINKNHILLNSLIDIAETSLKLSKSGNLEFLHISGTTSYTILLKSSFDNKLME